VQASSGPAIHERFARRLKEADRSAISPSQTWMERAKAARINSTMRRSLSRSLCIEIFPGLPAPRPDQFDAAQNGLRCLCHGLNIAVKNMFDRLVDDGSGDIFSLRRSLYGLKLCRGFEGEEAVAYALCVRRADNYDHT
jgi:hypothetical protein